MSHEFELGIDVIVSQDLCNAERLHLEGWQSVVIRVFVSGGGGQMSWRCHNRIKQAESALPFIFSKTTTSFVMLFF